LSYNAIMFGKDVAISRHVAVVGTFSGSASIFRKTEESSMWSQEWLVSKTCDAFGQFGYSVGTDGESVVVGSPSSSGGRIYVVNIDNLPR